MNNVIPPMTHPLSKHWEQPDSRLIIVGNKYVLMEEEIFSKLKDYSKSTPTGVYQGKMWKMLNNGKWWLCWFGEEEAGCLMNVRQILCPNHDIIETIQQITTEMQIENKRLNSIILSLETSNGLFKERINTLENMINSQKSLIHRIHDLTFTETNHG
jgi:predicted type IV restriction endonuclease